MGQSIGITEMVRLVLLARTHMVAAGIAVACTLAAPLQAQRDKMAPIPIPAQPEAIELGTGALPGAKSSESWHSQYGSVFARNVTVATLTPFLPDPAKATGTAVTSQPSFCIESVVKPPPGATITAVPVALAGSGRKGVSVATVTLRANTLPYWLCQDSDDFAPGSAPVPSSIASGCAGIGMGAILSRCACSGAAKVQATAIPAATRLVRVNRTTRTSSAIRSPMAAILS